MALNPYHTNNLRMMALNPYHTNSLRGGRAEQIMEKKGCGMMRIEKMQSNRSCSSCVSEMFTSSGRHLLGYTLSR